MSNATCAVETLRGEAFETTMVGFTGYLRQVARARMPRHPGLCCTVSDMVQETFYHACRDRAGFTGSTDRDLKFWLRGILLHRLQNLLRSLLTPKRDGGTPVPMSHPAVVAVMADSTTASRIAMRDEQGRLFLRALGRIDRVSRELILRHHGDGEPLESIAARLGTTRNAVGCRLRRARARLGREVQALR
jgi:RNA polymerase sigma factor (sigma-70 family)